MKRKIIHAVIFPLFLLVFPAWVAAGVAYEKPKLILQITVDQMRGDYPMRYKDRLGEGGFRYLMEKGTVRLPIQGRAWVVCGKCVATLPIDSVIAQLFTTVPNSD